MMWSEVDHESVDLLWKRHGALRWVFQGKKSEKSPSIATVWILLLVLLFGKRAESPCWSFWIEEATVKWLSSEWKVW